jgi:hypothetical protein
MSGYRSLRKRSSETARTTLCGCAPLWKEARESVDERQEGPMEPENDRSTRTAPSTTDVASTADEVGARTGVDEGDGAGDGQERRPLLADEELGGFRGRWNAVQVRFVDEPRGSVQEADGLVAELMQRLAQTFSEERASLESRWEKGSDVSTEDLRVALQRYRSFFDRLLST